VYESVLFDADGHHVPRMQPTAVRGHEMDAALWILHNVLGTVDEDLEGVADVQGEVGAQTEAHRQTAVAVDDAHTGDNTGLHGSMDAQRSASGRTGKGDRHRPEVLAVFERLVGLLSGGRYVVTRSLLITRFDRMFRGCWSLELRAVTRSSVVLSPSRPHLGGGFMGFGTPHGPRIFFNIIRDI